MHSLHVERFANVRCDTVSKIPSTIVVNGVSSAEEDRFIDLTEHVCARNPTVTFAVGFMRREITVVVFVIILISAIFGFLILKIVSKNVKHAVGMPQIHVEDSNAWTVDIADVKLRVGALVVLVVGRPVVLDPTEIVAISVCRPIPLKRLFSVHLLVDVELTVLIFL